MKTNKLRKKKEAARRIAVKQIRDENTKEGDLKVVPLDTSKARKLLLSVDSKKVLREEENSRTTESGFSGYCRKKFKDIPGLANLPTDKLEAMKVANKSLKAIPKPNPYYLQLQ